MQSIPKPYSEIRGKPAPTATNITPHPSTGSAPVLQVKKKLAVVSASRYPFLPALLT